MKQIKKYVSIILAMMLLLGVLSTPAVAASTIKVPTVGSVSATSSAAGKLTVKWARVRGAYRYQVVIARNSSFTSGVTKSTVGATKSSKTFTNLKKGSRYYAKVRVIKRVNGNNKYGKYSTVKSCIVKKSSISGTRPGSGIVYWTPSGSVYHTRRSCPTLSRSRTVYSGSISQSRKSRKCKVC